MRLDPSVLFSLLRVSQSLSHRTVLMEASDGKRFRRQHPSVCVCVLGICCFQKLATVCCRLLAAQRNLRFSHQVLSDLLGRPSVAGSPFLLFRVF